MTLGKKIKLLRTEKKMTQSELCDGKITRNLLSEIECDKASPSIHTLKFIAMRLETPLSYLLSDEEDMFFYTKKEHIEGIKRLFASKSYRKCIDLIEALPSTDDELNYIMAHCHFELGRGAILHGSLRSGSKHLKKSSEFCAKTVYDTLRIENLILMYSALAQNVQSPLLEFNKDVFLQNLNDDCDFELYKYLVQDFDYSFKNPIYSKHIEAKNLIKSRKYREAVALLTEIEAASKSDYNSHLVFTVYCDLENCYRQLMDFESAYRYASKRLSLIEGFKS